MSQVVRVGVTVAQDHGVPAVQAAARSGGSLENAYVAGHGGEEAPVPFRG